MTHLTQDEAELVARLREACAGHPHAKVAWPHRVLHEAADAISRIAEERAVMIDIAADLRRKHPLRWKFDMIDAAEARATAAEAALSQMKEARRDAIEECARLLDEGYERAVAAPYRNDGARSKNDMCQHDRYMYEDCEACAATAIRALAQQPDKDAP